MRWRRNGVGSSVRARCAPLRRSCTTAGPALLALSALALTVACASGPAPSEADDRLPWDQDRVTTLAQELDTSVKALRQAALDDPSLRASRGGQDQQAARLYLDSLRELERSVGQLARRLESGDGYEETLGNARRIGTLLRDVQEESRRLMVNDEQLRIIEPARATIEALSPYYSSRSPLLPATRR